MHCICCGNLFWVCVFYTSFVCIYTEKLLHLHWRSTTGPFKVANIFVAFAFQSFSIATIPSASNYFGHSSILFGKKLCSLQQMQYHFVIIQNFKFLWLFTLTTPKIMKFGSTFLNEFCCFKNNLQILWMIYSTIWYLSVWYFISIKFPKNTHIFSVNSTQIWHMKSVI